jgi:hypothetical protein
VAGRLQRGLPQDWESVAKSAKAEIEKRRAAAQQPAAPAPSSGSLRIGPIIDPNFRIITGGGAPAPQQPAAGGLSPVTIGVGVAALAAVAFIATRK